MIEIKKVDDSDFYILQLLHRKMCSEIDETLSNSRCAHSLITELNLIDSCAIGLYKNNELVGFTLGYGVSEDTYYFSALYIEKEFRLHALELLKTSELAIPGKYKQWQTDSAVEAGKNILTKFGATELKVVYRKAI